MWAKIEPFSVSELSHFCYLGNGHVVERVLKPFVINIFMCQSDQVFHSSQVGFPYTNPRRTCGLSYYEVGANVLIDNALISLSSLSYYGWSRSKKMLWCYQACDIGHLAKWIVKS